MGVKLPLATTDLLETGNMTPLYDTQPHLKGPPSNLPRPLSEICPLTHDASHVCGVDVMRQQPNSDIREEGYVHTCPIL